MLLLSQARSLGHNDWPLQVISSKLKEDERCRNKNSYPHLKTQTKFLMSVAMYYYALWFQPTINP